MMHTYDKKNTCCFTGHRYIEADKTEKIKKALQQKIAEQRAEGVCRFISGGALGFDTLAALSVLEAKLKYPEILLVMLLPCRDQCARWGYNDRLIYEELLKKADEIYFLNEKYITGCMHQRNREMVRQSGHCIAYFNGRQGGTAYTFDLAKEQGVDVDNIYYEI